MNSIVIGEGIGNLLSCIFPRASLDFSWDLWNRVSGFNAGLWSGKSLFGDAGGDQKKVFFRAYCYLVLSFGLNE